MCGQCIIGIIDVELFANKNFMKPYLAKDMYTIYPRDISYSIDISMISVMVNSNFCFKLSFVNK